MALDNKNHIVISVFIDSVYHNKYGFFDKVYFNSFIQNICSSQNIKDDAFIEVIIGTYTLPSMTLIQYNNICRLNEIGEQIFNVQLALDSKYVLHLNQISEEEMCEFVLIQGQGRSEWKNRFYRRIFGFAPIRINIGIKFKLIGSLLNGTYKSPSGSYLQLKIEENDIVILNPKPGRFNIQYEYEEN